MKEKGCKSVIPVTDELPDGIKTRIRAWSQFTAVQQIHKGFSSEQKFLLTAHTTSRYLVRVFTNSDPGFFLYKKNEYDLICRLGTLSSCIPRAHLFGTSEQGEPGFMILDYIDGSDGEDALAALTDKKQYMLDIQEGDLILDITCGTGNFS